MKCHKANGATPFSILTSEGLFHFVRLYFAEQKEMVLSAAIVYQ